MARGANQKLKMLYIAKILYEETDDENYITVNDLISRLNSYGINADRKTLYSDFKELEKFGLDIIPERISRNTYYHIGGRTFELPELKLLVDSVQSDKFITDKKSEELIKKIEKLVSKYQAGQLQRQVMLAGRVKTMNESIYYNIDIIHQSINEDRQIKFQYFRWNIDKEMELRHDGKWYVISPWAFMLDDDNYYMVGYDAEDDKIKHYRVDKMLKLAETEEARQGRESFGEFTIPDYKNSLFGMFSGEVENVTLRAENKMAGVLIDRFGRDIVIKKDGDDHFTTTVSVAVSDQFLGWIFGLGGGVQIVSPDSVVDKMKEQIRLQAEAYSLCTDQAADR